MPIEDMCKYELNPETCEVECIPLIAKNTEILTVEQMISDDKRYGTLKPRNGKYFTFKVKDMPQEELPRKTILKAVQHGLNRIRFHTTLHIKHEKDDSITPDITIIGRTPATDERKEMSPNTIMYAYYPINDLNNPNRGIVVVNTDFDYTVDGTVIPIPGTNSKKKTIDMDQVFGHEFGHTFGLPHDNHRGTLMYPYNSEDSEFSHERDISRFQAKIGKTTRSKELYKLIIKWFYHRSDHY